MKRTYPYTGIATELGLVVRFIREGSGSVVERGKTGYAVGYYCSSWAEQIFIPIEEEEKKEMKKGDLIIGSIHKTTGAFSTTASPKEHTNFITAQQEAERLAKADTSKRFVVLEVKGICEVTSPVKWS